MTNRDNLSLLNDPVAQELLHAPIPARLAYVWKDGTPRVIPIWFYWTGEEIILCSPPTAPKMKVLGAETKVALCIDTEAWPNKSLTVRGTARTIMLADEAPEYPELVRKYLGDDGAAGWREQYKAMFPDVVRIAVRPERVDIIDLRANRFPSAIMAVLSGSSPA